MTDAPAPLHFLVRLVPPRPDFPFSMSEAERTAMAAHAEYYRRHMSEGVVLVAGPVADPAGSWGMSVLRVGSTEQLAAFEENDPVILAGLGMRYEHMPLLSLMYPR
jgi:hypothetical protein